MSVISSVQEASKWTFELEIPADALDQQVAEQKNIIRSNVEYPGFRKGKVPDHILTMRLGPQFGVSEGIDKAIQAVARDVIVGQSLKVVGSPSVTKMDSYTPNQPLRFTLEVEVLPSVTMGPYKGLTHHVSLEPVTDERVKQEVKGLMGRLHVYPTVSRPIVTGDVALIDIKATDADGSIIDQWTKEKGGYGVGTGLFGTQLDDALIGKSAGDSFEATESFPSTFEFEVVAGKTISFSGTVTMVRSHDPAELTDDIVSTVFQVPTVDGLFELVRSNLEQVAQRQFEDARIQALMSQVTDAMTVTVSDTLTELEMGAMVEEEKERLKTNHTTLEKALAESNMTETEWKEQLKPHAVQRVKAALAYAEIVSLEGIELGQDDVVAFVQSKKPEWRREDVLANWSNLNLTAITRILVQDRALALVVSSSVYESLAVAS